MSMTLFEILDAGRIIVAHNSDEGLICTYHESWVLEVWICIPPEALVVQDQQWQAVEKRNLPSEPVSFTDTQRLGKDFLAMVVGQG